MKTSILIANEFLDTINNGTELINSIVASNKEGKSKSTQKQLSFNKEKLIHLIGYLYERTNNLYNNKKRYNGIAISTLKDIINFSSTKQTSLHLDILIELGLIVKSGTPKVGIRSYEYTAKQLDLFLTSGYNEQFTKYTFSKNKIKNPVCKLIQELNSRVNIDTLSIEYQNIKNALITNDKQNESHIKYVEEYFKNKDFSFTISTTNNRRMSVFTSCKKEFRKLITIDGEKVIALDFANSQPAFLANYILYTYNKYKIKLSDDIKLFIKLCSNGKIYEYIAQELFNGDRNQAKELWMSAGYGHMSIRTIGDEILQENKKGLLLATLFPNVISFLDSKKTEDYSQISIKLQIYESKFVNMVSDLLFEAGILNITVYDEFIVKESDLDEAHSIINEQINLNELNITLKIDKDNTNEEVKMIEEFDIEILTDKTLEKYKEFKGDREAIVGLIRNLTGHNKWSINDYYSIMDKVVTTRFHHIPLVKKENTLEKTIKYIL